MFIDDLAISLFTILMAGVLLLYMTGGVFLDYKRKGVKNVYDHITPGVIPFMVLGSFILVMALYGEFTWPLPGSYNILYYDTYALLGLAMLAFSISALKRMKLNYVGMFSMLSGFIAIYYGLQAYSIKLSTEPLALLGLLASFGMVGVFAYPVTLLLDTLPGEKSKHQRFWYLMLACFWIFLVIGIALAALLAAVALHGHLISPP
jgi:putative membrane protein